MAIRTLSPSEAEQLRTTLLAGEQDFNPDWVSKDSKLVVPAVEITDLSDDPDGVRLVEAFAAAGYTELLCLTTSDLGPDEPGQAAAVSVDGAELDEWRWDVSSFDVVIAAPDLAHAVLLSVDEFALVGGTPDFVEAAFGSTIGQARGKFGEYAEEMGDASRHLPAIAARYGCA